MKCAREGACRSCQHLRRCKAKYFWRRYARSTAIVSQLLDFTIAVRPSHLHLTATYPSPRGYSYNLWVNVRTEGGSLSGAHCSCPDEGSFVGGVLMCKLTLALYRLWAIRAALSWLTNILIPEEV